MRLVTWTDDDGYRRRAHVREGDLDEKAPDSGVPADVPDVSQLDWKEVEKDLHNMLSDRGYITWADVQRSQNGISTVVKLVLSRRIILLYRQQDSHTTSQAVPS